MLLLTSRNSSRESDTRLLPMPISKPVAPIIGGPLPLLVPCALLLLLMLLLLPLSLAG